MSVDSFASWITSVGSEGYFIAANGARGKELWRTDGTTSGTQAIDVVPGPQSSYPSFPVNVGGLVYFSASTDGISQLWKSDGAAAGTVAVKDLANIYGITDWNGDAYFVANDNVHGAELWKSNGSTIGTVLVKDIIPGAASSVPNRLTAAGDILFFTVDDGIHGSELWKTDGTAAGTEIVKDIYPGGNANPSAPLQVGDSWYFTARDASGIDIWKTDGTAAGTVKVTNLSSGNIIGMTRLNEISFTFIANSSLWISDGTQAGTTLVKEVQLGASYYAVADEVLYFVVFENMVGSDLWRSDGTAAGTYLVKKINPSGSSAPSFLTAVGSTVYFSATNPATGEELWKTDGTEAGTVLVKDINPTITNFPSSKADSSSPSHLVNVDGKLFFTADDGVHGVEVWTSDGTAEGTRMLRNIGTGQNSSNPVNLFDADDTLYFAATLTGGSEQVCFTDGTEAGTKQIANPYQTFLHAGNFTRIGNTVYFSRGAHLYRTVVGSSTAELVRNSDGEIIEADVTNFLTVDDVLSFTVRLNDGTAELYRILPTESLAEMILAAAITDSVEKMEVIGGDLYIFTYNYEANTSTLWKIDGASAATINISQFSGRIRDGSGESDMRDARLTGKLLFTIDGYAGVELWITDGSSAGTLRITDPADPSAPRDCKYLEELNGRVYFAAITDSAVELWSTDGRPEGTMEVKDLNLNDSDDLSHITKVNDKLFFAATYGSYGSELWVCDGTAEGTYMLRDINASGSSSPREFAPIDGLLYFSADDGVHGREPWVSDGTAMGTYLLQDISPGVLFSSPRSFCGSGSYVYFSADYQDDMDSTIGRELWAIPRADPGSAVEEWFRY